MEPLFLIAFLALVSAIVLPSVLKRIKGSEPKEITRLLGEKLNAHQGGSNNSEKPADESRDDLKTAEHDSSVSVPAFSLENKDLVISIITAQVPDDGTVLKLTGTADLEVRQKPEITVSSHPVFMFFLIGILAVAGLFSIGYLLEHKSVEPVAALFFAGVIGVVCFLLLCAVLYREKYKIDKEQVIHSSARFSDEFTQAEEPFKPEGFGIFKETDSLVCFCYDGDGEFSYRILAEKCDKNVLPAAAAVCSASIGQTPLGEMLRGEWSDEDTVHK